MTADMVTCPHCEHEFDASDAEQYTVGTIQMPGQPPPLPHAICTVCGQCIKCPKEESEHNP